MASGTDTGFARPQLRDGGGSPEIARHASNGRQLAKLKHLWNFMRRH
jgi:hypothetical protein